MPFSLQVTPHQTYLHAVLNGEVSTPAARDALANILDSAWDNRQPHVLIDWRQVTGLRTLSTTDRFDQATFLVGLVRQLRGKGLADIRIAQVLPEFRTGADDFSQTVAVNRGVAMRITADLTEALNWLGVQSVP